MSNPIPGVKSGATHPTPDEYVGRMVRTGHPMILQGLVRNQEMPLQPVANAR